KVNVYTDNNTFQETRWTSLRVGDLIKVFKDEYFHTDLLLLSSSYEDGICYVETSNLDGKTNLKVFVKCEDPNEDLYTFIGTLYYDKQQNPLLVQQILLRGSKLWNTDYVDGVVIFTGHDTKVMENSTDPLYKRSGIEKRMDRIIYVVFGTLITIAFIGLIFFGIETKNEISGALVLYGYLIPISLYVSIELMKVLKSIFINQDMQMYYEKTNKPAIARTSNLNEELSKIDLCPPSVEANMVNDGTLPCKICIDQLVFETVPPLEDVCDIINEPQVSDGIENVGQVPFKHDF
ncbi:putative phospholipid-transporting ATPase 8, partial [Capsicum chinense]